MRSLREVTSKSPRPKIILKSPQVKLKSRLKIKSTIHQPPKQALAAPKDPPQNEPTLCLVPELHILEDFEHFNQQLETLRIRFFSHLPIQGQTAKVHIVSSIDKFSDFFVEIAQLKIECQTWIILSGAVNSRQAEANFNQIYSPINFIFLPTVSHILNYFLHASGTCRTLIVPAVYTIGIAPNNSLLCVQEFMGRQLKDSHIYLVQHRQEGLKQLMASIQKTDCLYFLTGEEHFQRNADGQVQLAVGRLRRLRRKQKLVLVCLNWETSLDKLAGLAELEEQFRQNLLKGRVEINENNIGFGKRVVSSFLKAQHRLCFFCEGPSIPSLRDALKLDVLWFPVEMYVPGPDFYLLGRGPKTRSALQLRVGSPPEQEMCRRIQTFLQGKSGLRQKVEESVEMLQNMNVKVYTKEHPSHLIEVLLEEAGVKVAEISQLESLFETHQITLILGYFSLAEIESLQSFYNVFVVPICREPEDGAPLVQLAETAEFLGTAARVHKEMQSDPGETMTEAYVHVLYTDREQIYTILQSIQIPEPMLKTQFIGHFELSLSDLQQYSKHLVLIEMQDFSEQIEGQIKEVQWRNNTLSIQVYLKYGNEFIQLTKNGSYHFIKPMEIQGIIDSIHELSSRPEPESRVPEPLSKFSSENQVQIGDERDKDSKIEVYKLYILIHRSVPIHNLTKGHERECRILLYSRIEEALILCRYLRGEEKVVVIANEQSATLYSQLLAKSGIEREKLRVVFLKDMAEGSIRKNISWILQEENLSEHLQEDVAIKFKALVVYSGFNDRIVKVVTTVKKIFGPQLKLLFMKEKDYEQLGTSQPQLSINQDILIYKVGLSAKPSERRLPNFKSLFILAMHPSLRQFEYYHNNVTFGLISFIGRMLHGERQKNYEIGVKKTKELYRQGLYATKLGKARSKETVFSKVKAKPGPRSAHSINSKRRISSRSSEKGFKSDSRYEVIISGRLAEFWHSKLGSRLFHSPATLCAQVLACQSVSKLPIVVLHEEDLAELELLADPSPRRHPDILYVVHSSVEGKQAFSSPNTVFCPKKLLTEAVNSLIQQYINFTHFDGLEVHSEVVGIMGTTVCGQGAKTPSIPLRVRAILNDSQKVEIALVGKEVGNKCPAESISFANVVQANRFLNSLAQTYRVDMGNKGQKKGKCNKNQAQIDRGEEDNRVQPYIFGTVLFCPQDSVCTLRRGLQGWGKKDVRVKGYRLGKWGPLMEYRLERVLILLEKEKECVELWDLPFSMGLEEEVSKMRELLSIVLS